VSTAILDSSTAATVAAATTQDAQLAALAAPWAAGNVTVRHMAGATISETSTHGPWAMDSLTPRGMTLGPLIASTVNVSAATITSRVYVAGSTAIFSQPSADITQAAPATLTGRRINIADAVQPKARIKANADLPMATTYRATFAAADTATVNVAAAGSITNTGTGAIVWSITPPSNITVTPSSGTLAAGGTQALSITATTAATHSLTLVSAGATITGNPQSIVVDAAPATSLTLSVPSTGTAGVAVDVTVTPNGPVSGGGTVTLATTAGTLGSTTLTWTAGQSAAKTTTLTLASAGSADVSMTTGAGLTLVGSPATFTAASSVPAGQFSNVSTNVLTDVNPCPANNCAYSGSTGGPAEIFRVWCGGVWAPEYGANGAFLMFGGGHMSYDGNSVFAFRGATLDWVNHGTPAAYADGDIQADGEYPDGTPPPPHTYALTGYLPPAWGGGTLGDLLVSGLPGAAVEQRVHAMDLSTGVWRRFTSSALTLGNTYGSMVRDDAREGWWIVPAVAAQIYFLSKLGVITAKHTNTNRNSNAESVTCLIPGEDILVCFDFASGNVPKFQYLDLAVLEATPASSGWQTITTSGTPPSSYKSGFEYIPALDKIVSYIGTGQDYVYTLSVPATLSNTWSWATQTLTPVGGISPSYVSGNLNGHWRRFVDAPQLGYQLWVESGTGPVQAWTVT
jgi:hypothetical protein